MALDAVHLVPLLGAMSDIFTVIFYILFFLASVMLIAIVLLQEGKGGGFTAAFGGVGTEAFGVKAGGINKLTSFLAALFVVTALLLGVMTKGEGGAGDITPEVGPTAPGQPGAPPGAAPVVPGGAPAGAPPAGVPAGAPPAGAPTGAPPAGVPAGAPPAGPPAGDPPTPAPAGR